MIRVRLRAARLLLSASLACAWGCGGAAPAAAPGGGAPAPARAVAAPPPPAIVPAAPSPRPSPVPAPLAVAADDPCDPFANLAERRERDLTVPVEPTPPARPFLGRMRHHADGSLSRGSPRRWIGPRVPRFVPLHEGSSELHLLEQVPDGWVAMYRDPYGAGSCELSGNVNCRVVFAGFGRCGERRWTRDLTPLWSRPSHLEVQDFRVADGVLYYNEACQTYAREAGGQCSALVALDPASGRILWRTRPLTSNNRFLVHGRWLVVGYGFTAEPDHVALVRRSDGAVVARRPLASAHEDLALEGPETLVVRTYPGDRAERFTLEGLDGDAPRIVPAR